MTAPFDVVKTHRQIEFGEKVLYAEHPAKSLPKAHTLAILKRIYGRNGLQGIFAGVTPRIAKIAPACAIMITSFEYGKAFFFRQNVTKHLHEYGYAWPQDWNASALNTFVLFNACIIIIDYQKKWGKDECK